MTGRTSPLISLNTAFESPTPQPADALHIAAPFAVYCNVARVIVIA